MSPRATDNGMRAPAPAPSPISLDHGRRKPKKPLSSGFKAVVWTSPPPVGTHSMGPAATSSQQRTELPRSASSPSTRASSDAYSREKGHHHRVQRTKSNVEPFEGAGRRERSFSSSAAGRLPQAHAPKPPQPARSRLSRANSVGGSRAMARTDAEAGGRLRHQQRLSCPPAEAPTKANVSKKERRVIRGTRSEEFGDRLSARALQHLPAPAAVEGTGMDSSTSQSLPHSFPVLSRRPSLTDAHGNIVMERSLSDTSVVTASDFGAPKSNKPVILATQMSDKDAIEGFVALLGKGKGLPVVKHATGLGGGKSRKLLKLNQQGDWHLALCGTLPPYFKTKIPVLDVDRVEAKWCCVVVHAKGRSPLRLEVDSFATADTLRLGLMAASRTQPTPPPPPAATASEVNQQQRRHEHQQAAGAAPPAQDQDPQAPPPDHEGLSLSSVRPGHHSSQIYDPDAALSVAALLAKEMEQERLQALQALQEGTRGGEHGAMWASARNCYLPEASAPAAGEEGQAPKPLLKRSASMNSMVGSGLAEKKPPAVDPATNRRSLPRGYGGPMIAPGAGGGEELVVVDAKASLRRLYDAIEGRGMVAIKRNPNGKGRSRVMVRSRIKDKTIGWAHVLPPFTRKFVNVRELVGAQRSSRVVTVKFKNREPVMFETDKLTDALILEQGFVSLAKLQMTEVSPS